MKTEEIKAFIQSKVTGTDILGVLGSVHKCYRLLIKVTYIIFTIQLTTFKVFSVLCALQVPATKIHYSPSSSSLLCRSEAEAGAGSS